MTKPAATPRIFLAALLTAFGASTGVALGAPAGADLARIESLLDAGRLPEADSLFNASEADGARADNESRHRREIITARLAAAQGNWKKTDARLRAWKLNPDRTQGSGEIFFWLGWSALHQGKKTDADSLFVLASAYTSSESKSGGARGAQEALEYRFAALLENSPSLLDYLRGLAESPLPDSMRLTSLERLPKTSRLYPYGQWQLALLLDVLGDTTRSREVLTRLAANPATLPGRKAAARLGYAREKSEPDSARYGYEGLLMKQQQGVSSEFARKRLQSLR
jgi:hypothetical protein